MIEKIENMLWDIQSKKKKKKKKKSQTGKIDENSLPMIARTILKERSLIKL